MTYLLQVVFACVLEQIERTQTFEAWFWTTFQTRKAVL